MTNFNAVEIFALIVIVVAIIKIVIFIYKPEAWISFIETLYSHPQLISAIGLVSSVVVLYFLVNTGLTVVEILAVSLFIALLMLTGIANYADQIVGWAREQDMVSMLKQLLIYVIAWLFLIILGIRELFFK